MVASCHIMILENQCCLEFTEALFNFLQWSINLYFILNWKVCLGSSLWNIWLYFWPQGCLAIAVHEHIYWDSFWIRWNFCLWQFQFTTEWISFNFPVLFSHLQRNLQMRLQRVLCRRIHLTAVEKISMLPLTRSVSSLVRKFLFFSFWGYRKFLNFYN